MIRVSETSISGIPSIPGVTGDFVPKHRLVVPKMERECAKGNATALSSMLTPIVQTKTPSRLGLCEQKPKGQKTLKKYLEHQFGVVLDKIAILGCSVVVVARKDLREPARNLRETCENLREPARTCENLREPARICENLRGICKKLPKFLDSSKMSKTRNFASNSYWVGVSSTFVLIWSFAHHRSKIPKNERFEGRQHLGKFCTGLWSASQWLSFNVYMIA